MTVVDPKHAGWVGEAEGRRRGDGGEVVEVTRCLSTRFMIDNGTYLGR